MPKKLTNLDIDNRINKRSIKRIGDIINAKTKLKFQCLINNCNFIWETCPDKVLNQKSGCPKCARNIKLSDKEVDERLKKSLIIRVGAYKNANSFLDLKCLKCKYKWKTSATGPLYSNTKCPQCSNRLKLSNKIIDIRLDKRSIKRIGAYKNMHISILFKCLKDNCNHKWSAKPYNIIYNERGCPNCATNKNEKLIGEVLLKFNIDFEKQKLIKKINLNEKSNIRVDYFLKKYNCIVEYNGIQHYKPVKFFSNANNPAEQKLIKQRKRDKYLIDFCKRNNIKLIVIDGRKYKNVKLSNYLFSLFKSLKFRSKYENYGT